MTLVNLVLAKDQEHVVLVVDVVVGLCALTRQESKVGIPVNVHEGVEACQKTGVSQRVFTWDSRCYGWTSDVYEAGTPSSPWSLQALPLARRLG